MAFAAQLEKEGLKPTSIKTTATVSLEKAEEGFSILAIHLQVIAKVPHAEQTLFNQAANNAKEGCPVSKLMKATITMDALLEQ
jgi:lipoyl-dependent peroxiredoxin